jgi:putative endonuclease
MPVDAGGEVSFWVYILASRRNGTLYVGMTNDLVRRVFDHREKICGGFTAVYEVTRLVYFERHATAEEAIAREKRVKRWRRQWKLELIERDNPQWRDLWEDICG